tara:strand:- start:24 stop:653 length:630 start_codon:yes stop_codon:yes gene_type:complete
MPTFEIERSYKSRVIGLDEVGRGPLAGPVVSCACFYKNYTTELEKKLSIVDDSKKLNSKKRNNIFAFLKELVRNKLLFYKLGTANVKEIDKLNILEATKLSMKRSLDKFNLNSGNLIIDGNFKLNYKNFKEQPIIKGDQISLSIATASIIAKVYRDRIMKILSKKYSEFHWEENVGYGTKKHIEAILRLGPTKYHRKSFEPIKTLIHNK